MVLMPNGVKTIGGRMRSRAVACPGGLLMVEARLGCERSLGGYRAGHSGGGIAVTRGLIFDVS